jgi:hypothetical protein
LIAEIASRRCSLSRTWNASSSLLPTAPLTAATSDSLRGRRLPVPRRLGGFGGQLGDRADRDLHLLVTEHHRAQHDVFGSSLASDSTISTHAVPATTRSSSDVFSSVAVGLSRYWPLA